MTAQKAHGEKREVTLLTALRVWRTAAGEYRLGREINGRARRSASTPRTAAETAAVDLGWALTLMGGELGLTADAIREALE